MTDVKDLLFEVSFDEYLEKIDSNHYCTLPDIYLPLGIDDNKIVDINISQHSNGYLIGKTGTGKSNTLRAIVSGLIARYSPGRVSIALLDASPGDLADFDQSPSFTITVDELWNKDKMPYERIAYFLHLLRKEMRKREKFLSNYARKNQREIFISTGKLVHENSFSYSDYCSYAIQEYSGNYPLAFPFLFVINNCLDAIFSEKDVYVAAVQDRYSDIVDDISFHGDKLGIGLLQVRQKTENKEMSFVIDKDDSDINRGSYGFADGLFGFANTEAIFSIPHVGSNKDIKHITNLWDTYLGYRQFGMSLKKSNINYR